jgi:hypothetical protein
MRNIDNKYRSIDFKFIEIPFKNPTKIYELLKHTFLDKIIPVHIGKSSVIFFTVPKKYYIFLNKQDVPITWCKISLGAHSIIIIDRKNQVVYKCSFSSQGNKNIIDNYNFIQSKINIQCPKFINIVSHLPYIITCEQLLTGKFIETKDWDNNHFQLISKQLFSLFSTSKKSEALDINKEILKINSFNINNSDEIKKRLAIIGDNIINYAHSFGPISYTKAIIHGDLTNRNVVITGNRASFIDFDRSSFSYPEFDYYLLAIDLQTYLSHQINYFNFFNIAKQLLLDEKAHSIPMPAYVKKYSKIYSEKSKDLLRRLFIYRMLVYSISNITDTREGIKLIDHVVKLIT